VISVFVEGKLEIKLTMECLECLYVITISWWYCESHSIATTFLLFLSYCFTREVSNFIWYLLCGWLSLVIQLDYTLAILYCNKTYIVWRCATLLSSCDTRFHRLYLLPQHKTLEEITFLPSPEFNTSWDITLKHQLK